ncbi:MAG: ComEC family competence protein [Oscillospiraceae bacterium]|nr:ComEC family competence protein [Oscillospiraceae bacterium]
MKRPALWIGFPYLLGLVAASAVTGQFRIFLCIGLVTSALIVCLFSRTVWKYLLLSTLSCLTACCNYWHHETITIERQQDYAGQKTVFTGEVTELSIYDSGYAGYVLTGYFAENPEDTRIKIKLFCEDQNADYGDRITIAGIPERIQGNYIFDSAEYYQARNIFLEFGIMTEILEVEKNPKQDLFRKLVYGIYRWRTDMTKKILAQMGQETGGLMTGMLFGDKSTMSQETKRDLYRTGIGHILAVSGLHLDFLAVCVGFLLKKCHAGRKFSFGMIAIVCSLFVICAGGTVSVKRACIMILISRSAGIFFREPDTLNALSIAILLLGIENPFVIDSAAFWLSCSGAFGIGVVAEYMTKQENPEYVRDQSGRLEKFLRKILKNTISFCWVFVVILPVSVLYFKEISLISPLSNLLLVPVCMLMLILGAGAVCFRCEGIFAELCCSGADFLGKCVLRISDFVAGLSWTHTTLDSEIVVFLVLAGAVFVILVQIMIRDKKFTGIAVVFVLGITCLAVSVENILHMQELKIAILGNDTNCVIVVRSGTDAVLVDLSGHVKNAEYVSAYLEETGVQNIQEIYLNKPSEKILNAYDEYLMDSRLGRYYFRKELSKAELAELPEYVILDSQELLFHGALLKIRENRLEIIYEEKLFLCTNEKTSLVDLAEDPDILTIYGKSESIQPDCGILIILDENSCYDPEDVYNYIGENNLEITIAGNGRCKVRRLYDNF